MKRHGSLNVIFLRCYRIYRTDPVDKLCGLDRTSRFDLRLWPLSPYRIRYFGLAYISESSFIVNEKCHR